MGIDQPLQYDRYSSVQGHSEWTAKLWLGIMFWAAQARVLSVNSRMRVGYFIRVLWCVPVGVFLCIQKTCQKTVFILGLNKDF